MNIAIDMTSAEEDPTGIGMYIKNLVHELLILDKENKYLLIFSKKPEFLEVSDNEKNTRIEIVSKVPLPILRGVVWMMKVRGVLFKNKIDILISPSNILFSLLFPRTFQFVHDLGPILYPEFYPWKARLSYSIGIKYFLPRAYKILTVSKQVSKELGICTNFKKPIHVIYPSFNQSMTQTDLEIQKPNDSKYFLSVSTLQPRKNFINTIKAFYELEKQKKLQEYSYLIVGKKGWFYQELFDLVKKLNLEKKIAFTGYVKDEELYEFYKNTQGVIFMSHYEGFGMPLLETMSFKKPLLVSDIPVFHEVCGEYALYAPKSNPEKIAEKILELEQYKPDEKIANNILSKYNWRSSAKKLLGMINETKRN